MDVHSLHMAAALSDISGFFSMLGWWVGMRKRSDGETHREATGVVLGRGDEGFSQNGDLEFLNHLDFPRLLFT